MGKSVNNEPACIERCSLNLRRLQRRAIQLIMKQAGVLVNFGTGYGKTLTAVVASQCWLDQSRRNRVLVLTPTSLVQNFWDGTKKYGRLHHRKHYRVMSYRAYVQKQRYWCTVVKKNPTMLILDEVHGLRNHAGKTSRAVQRLANIAAKRVLLTATPIVNRLGDLWRLGCLVRGSEDAWDCRSARNVECLRRQVRQVFNDRVVVARRRAGDPHYPRMIQRYVTIPMPVQYYQRYRALVAGDATDDIQFETPQAFYNGHRRAVNKVGQQYFSLKMRAIRRRLKPNRRALIFSNWIEFGVRPIETMLARARVSFSVLTGNMAAHKRDQAVKRFNHGETRVLVISRAGSEGLDLRGVEQVFVMDPPWSNAAMQQIVGRAVRYGSHADLPPTRRVVRVYRLILTRPGYERRWRRDKVSGDAILYRIVEHKAQKQQEMDAMLRRAGRSVKAINKSR